MNKNAGFTLIEVLIAMVVLAVGLLGLAGLQVTSLRNNQSAYNRSQATQLAYDLADRMRANVAGVATYTTGTASAIANCKNITGCSPVEMATNDLYEWNCTVVGGCENNTPPIAATLPGGQGIVCLDSTPIDGTSAAVANCDGTGNTYAIKIWWDDDRSGVASQRFVTSFTL
jgi:type IV pilus assembly protein PilV